MSSPPKIAVFLLVLTAHLAILALAMPRLDDTASRHQAANSPAHAHGSAENKAADSSSRTTPPVAKPNAVPESRVMQNVPAATEKSTVGSDREQDRDGHKEHSHNLASSQSPEKATDKVKMPAAKREVFATTLPFPDPEPLVSDPDSPAAFKVVDAADTTAEPSPTVKPMIKPVSLTTADTEEFPAEPAAAPAPEPVSVKARPVPVAVATSAPDRTASARRMSNLRPLAKK